MLHIRRNILQRPFQPPLEGRFADAAFRQRAHAAGGGRHAAVGVDKHFQRLVELLADERMQGVYFEVGLIDVVVPGNSEVAVEVED